jgi:hypothetical protein
MNKLSKSQIASLIAGATGFIVANWSSISPEISNQLQSSWFAHHTGVRALVVGACFLVTLYARSIHGAKSGLPGQDPNVPVTTDTLPPSQP